MNQTILEQNQINRVIDKIETCYPMAGCELNYDSSYHLLVAVVLSAQTTDKGVNAVTEQLFREIPDAFAMIKLTANQLEDKIKRIGLYRSKAKNILALSKVLCEKYGGEVPCDYDALLQLPGVGRKTANVMMAEAFKIPAIAVDTHVFRLSNRIGIVCEDTVEKTEEALMQAIPREKWIKMHHCLIWHGRRCCKARHPDCDNCCLGDICLKKGL